MAGIGFELRRIFKRKSMFSAIWGTIYATMTTIGPTVIFILLLFVLKFALNFFGVSELEKLFFVSSFTYVFLVAILVSSVINTVLSRYISDCIFEEKEDQISASLFGVLTVGSVVSGMIYLAFCYVMYVTDHISLILVIAFYLLGILATNAYNLMTYVSAIKEYKEVTGSFLVGFLVAVCTFFLLYLNFQILILHAIYIALVAGFFFIDLSLIYCVVKAFGLPSKEMFNFLRYFKKYPELMVTGATYMLGFFISNIIYWNHSDMQVQISVFKTAPSYDLAMFLAIIVNLPAFVIFVVKVETVFYEKYVNYLSALNKGSYQLIEKRRQNLQNTLRMQLFFVYEVQLMITILLIYLANVIFPYIGVGTHVFNMFMILAMGVYTTICMYFTIVFLYYFEDYVHACIVSFVYLVLETSGAIICAYIGSPYYPLPILISGILGWILAFTFLRRRLAKLNGYLLCK